MERGEAQLEELLRAMHAAAAQGEFEKAAQLRDQISILRGLPGDAPENDIDPSGLVRQKPGAMGLGTSRQHVTPPPGWKPPKKPDLMTTGRKRGRKAPD